MRYFQRKGNLSCAKNGFVLFNKSCIHPSTLLILIISTSLIGVFILADVQIDLNEYL
jgi:hypothetical protein